MAEPQMVPALLRVPLDRLEPGPNARGQLGDVAELALSIRAIGLQKPLLVHDLGDGRYRVLDGHRRLAAAQLLELPHVDVVLRRDAGDAARIKQQLAIHTHARGFDPIAEAKALSELMFEHKLTREQIAEAVGRTPGWVRDRIALLQLEEDEQRSISAGRLPVSHANAILGGRRAARDGRSAVWAPGTQGKSKAPSRPAHGAAAVRSHCTTCRCEEVRDGG